MSRTTFEVYAAAHESAVLVDRSRLSALKISGKSRLDLLNRLSTQAVNNLQPGQGAATVLTTDIGRIIDRLLLYVASDTVYAFAGEGHAPQLVRYLRANVFFNDDFLIADISAETAVWGVYGPQAGAFLAAAGFPEIDLPLHHWRQAQLDGAAAYLHRADPIAGDGYLVTAGAADREALERRLLATGLTPADESAYELLRIEAGLPRFGRELTLDYIPLEADLWDDVSFHKGCYVGQEIIARMESRGRLAKRLVRLRPESMIPAGTELTAGDRPAGIITSIAAGPDGPLALGYVKTAILEEPVELTAAGVRVMLRETPAVAASL